MAILTRARLAAITERGTEVRTFSEVLNEVKSQTRYSVTTTIFLSHCHDDLRDGTVDKAIVFLRKMGVSIYIDSNDSSMPPFTNAATAARIKQAIEQNKKFILLATDRAIASKWCNWELGIGDAKRYINAIALLPVADNSNNYTGSEYHRIYPRIEEEAGIYGISYKVYYPDGTSKALAEWLK